MSRLSAQAIVAYQNINSFNYANQWNMSAGDTATLYFQVIDLDQNISAPSTNLPYKAGYPINSPTGNAVLRHLLGVGTANQPYSILVTFPSINSANVIQLLATQADAQDSSIWYVSIPQTMIPNSGAVIFKVVEGNNVSNFTVMNMISVDWPENCGSDGTLFNSNSTAEA